MLDALRRVWNEIGLNVAEQEAELDRQLHEFYQYKLMDANNTKSQYLDDIATMQDDIATFVQQLGEPFQAPANGQPSGTLKEQEAIVRADYESLKKAVDDRTAALTAVLKELTYIQALMGEAPENPPQPLDLTATVLDKFKEALRVKKIEQAHRRRAILKVADEYRALIEEVKVVDLTDFDRSIVTNVEALGQSMNLVELISTRIADLARLRAEREASKRSLVAQIQSLWDRLKVSPNERDEFMESCKGIGADDLRQVEGELARLQQLKRARLGDLLHDVRAQIRELWAALEVDPSGALFPAMHVAAADATEELLAVHESELKRLDAKATARKALLKYIDKREEIIAERTQYEESLKDPDRLIGRLARDTGRLLREEKLQAKIKHDLPKLTKVLLDKLPAWEAEHHTPFLLKGERYLDTIARVDAEYIKQKELDRVEKDRLKREKKAAASSDDKLGASTPKPKIMAKGAPPALTKRMSCPNQLSAAPPSPVIHNTVALARDSSKTKIVGPET